MGYNMKLRDFVEKVIEHLARTAVVLISFGLVSVILLVIYRVLELLVSGPLF